MQSSRIPAIYISKYNRFVDNILGRINRILGKSYDPVRVKLQTSDSSNTKKKNTSKKRKSGSKKKKSSTRSNIPVPPAANKMGEMEISRSLETTFEMPNKKGRSLKRGFEFPMNLQREISRAFSEEFGVSEDNFRVFRDPESEAREVAFRAIARAEEMDRVAKNVAKLRESGTKSAEQFSKVRPTESTKPAQAESTEQSLKSSKRGTKPAEQFLKVRPTESTKSAQAESAEQSLKSSKPTTSLKSSKPASIEQSLKSTKPTAIEQTFKSSKPTSVVEQSLKSSKPRQTESTEQASKLLETGELSKLLESTKTGSTEELSKLSGSTQTNPTKTDFTEQSSKSLQPTNPEFPSEKSSSSTESREFKNSNDQFYQLSRATESESREPSFVLISKTTDLRSGSVPIKNVTLEVRSNPAPKKKKKNNQRKNNKTKNKGKKGNQTKQNNKQSSNSNSKARATLFGLSTLRREGDVIVNTMNDYTNVRTNFVLGPLTLRVEKEFGKGSKRQLKSATATTAEMFGKLNLKIVHGGAATLQSIKVLQPKQVRVDSADNHEKTKQYMWKRSSHIASVVSRKLASAARSMLKPPPHS